MQSYERVPSRQVLSWRVTSFDRNRVVVPRPSNGEASSSRARTTSSGTECVTMTRNVRSKRRRGKGRGRDEENAPRYSALTSGTTMYSLSLSSPSGSPVPSEIRPEPLWTGPTNRARTRCIIMQHDRGSPALVTPGLSISIYLPIRGYLSA